jgi:2,5-diketo-D-gluconate reductase A
VSPAQVILRWHLQRGRVVIPKSASPERLAENISIVGFELDESDLVAIDSLEAGLRTGEDIETFN